MKAVSWKERAAAAAPTSSVTRRYMRWKSATPSLAGIAAPSRRISSMTCAMEAG